MDTPAAAQKVVPVAAVADEPSVVLDDLVATATGSEPEMVKAEPLVAEPPQMMTDMKDVPVTEALISERADAEQEQLTDAPPIDTPTMEECEADNIGYEIVTG